MDAKEQVAAEMVVVDQMETAIQWGGVDVQVEIVARPNVENPTPYAQVSVTADEPLDLTLGDVRTIRDLADRVIAAMEQEPTK